MSRLDSEGTFRATVNDHGINFTQTGKPQLVAYFGITEKYITDPAELEHFGLEEPGWVDWSEYGETIDAYLLLFNSDTEFNEETAMKNYEQACLALGWEGDDFTPLGGGKYAGQSVLIRCAEEEYNGNTTIKVKWLDHADADPERSVKKLEADDLKALNSKLKIGGKKKGAAAAKPKATKPKPKTTTKPKATTPPKATKPKAEPEAEPEQEEATTAAPAGIPDDLDQESAWNFLQEHKGDLEDNVIVEAWTAAGAEVGGDEKEDTDFTADDWKKLVQIVVRDCGLNIK